MYIDWHNHFFLQCHSKIITRKSMVLLSLFPKRYVFSVFCSTYLKIHWTETNWLSNPFQDISVVVSWQIPLDKSKASWGDFSLAEIIQCACPFSISISFSSGVFQMVTLFKARETVKSTWWRRSSDVLGTCERPPISLKSESHSWG